MITPSMEGFEISSGAAKVTSGIVQDAVPTDLKDAAVVLVSAADLEKLTLEQVRGKVLVIDMSAAGGGGMRRMTSTAKLEPALVIVLAAGNLPRNMGAARPVMRDASLPASKAAMGL